MRFSTLLLTLGLLGRTLLPVRAAIVDVQVGPNGSNSYAPATVNINVGDQIRFVYVSGFHPTVSDSTPPLWPTFTLSSSTTTYTTPVFSRPGTFTYHCSVHATQLSNGTWVGMVGSIVVTGTPLPTIASQPTGPALNLYPNPTRGQVAVQLLAAPVGNNYQVRLTNVLGREIRRFVLTPTATFGSGQPVDLTGLPAGLYFCSLLINDQTVSTNRLTLL